MEFDQNKLFVGGLSRGTSEEALKNHFSKYGVVLSAVVARDKLTRSSRGFGFVLFSEQSSADKALEESQVILGRTVEVKKAITRREQHHLQQQHRDPSQLKTGALGNSSGNGDSNVQFRTKKVFVGGLSANVAEKEFKDYFERFGRITDVVVMHDSATNRPRGFGFVTFDTQESVEKVLQKSFHELNGRLVEVKRAVPRENFNNGTNSTMAGSASGSFQPVDYTPTNPGYGGFPMYAPHTVYNGLGRYYYGTGIYGCEYPASYPSNNFFMAPVAPRAPFYSPVIVGGSTYPLPYGGAPAYSVYVNAGTAVMGMAVVGGYNGIPPSAADAKLAANASHTEGLRSEMECLHLKKSAAAGASVERDQR